MFLGHFFEILRMKVQTHASDTSAIKFCADSYSLPFIEKILGNLEKGQLESSVF